MSPQKDIFSKVPKIRFGEFQDEWNSESGGTLFDSISDKNHNSDLPILAITQDKGAVPRDLIDYNISVTDKSIESYKIVRKGDFIISLRSFQGGIEYSDYEGICSPAYIILRPSQKIVDYFFKNLFKTDRYITEMNRKLEGIRDGKMVSYKYFSEILINYPSIPEQQKIVSFLSSIDEKIEKLKLKKSLLEQYKKGVMQKIFNQEIWFRDKGGKEFPKWKEKKLGDICKIKTGKKDVNEGNPLGQYPFFTCAKNHTYSDSYSFDSDAILIAGNGEVGHCQRYSGRFEAYQRTYVLSDFSEDIDYIYCHLNSTFQDFVSSLKQKGAMPYIKLGMLTDFTIPIPSLPEQQKIAAFLITLDAKVELLNGQFEQYRQWKKGLLQGMFV